jgi:hypothetical protein
LAAVLALASVTATAQELRGRVDGTVTDNTGGVLPGVTVTVSGPALIQPQVAVTGADGSYRFPAALPTGLYSLVFELSGFQTVRREEIRVGLATTVTINVQMPLAGVEETLTITGESPVVDVRNTNVGTSFTKELMQDIPNARDVWAAMSQSPGFHMTGYDVGGSHTGTQTGYSTYGFEGQNKTLLEGINVTEGRNANAGYFDFGSFEEFSIGGAGNMGEQTGPGAFLNLTIKSGGDNFSAQLYYDYENDQMVSDNVPESLKTGGGVDDGYVSPAGGLSRGNEITKQYDFNVNGGGPIVKGKAWFFGSYRDNNQYKVIAGLPGEEAQSQLVNYTIKGTYQVNARNQIIGFFNQRTKLQPLRNLSLAVPTETAWYQSSKNRPWKVEWTSTPSDTVFVDLQFADWGNFFPLFPSSTQSESTEGVPIGRIDLGTNQYSGAQSYYHDRTTLKPQFTGSVSYFKDDWGGSHSFKFGTEIQRERREFLRFQPGNIWYRDRNGVPEEVWIYNTPNEGINDTFGTAFYAQDSWVLNNRLTLNLGLRFDRYSIGWPEQSFTAEQSTFFPPVTTPATDVATLTSLGPRLGFAYDLTGDGKTVVKGFYGRFYYNPSTDIGSLENPVGEAEQQYRFNDLNGNKILDPGPDGTLNASPELGALLRTRGGAGFVQIDRNLENSYGDELSFHVERELMENFSLRGSYVYKNQRNGWGEVDMARYDQYTIPFTFNDIGADNVAGTADDQVLNLMDRPRGLPSDRVMTNPGNVPGMPDNSGNYNTFEIGLNKRFSKNWLLLTSFEHSWLSDWRRSASSTSTLGVLRSLQPVLTTWLWRPNQRYLGTSDTTFWNYKLVGRYVFPHDIGVSGSYKLQSGFHFARELSVNLPNAGAEAIPAEPIDSNRAPNIGIFDIRVEKTFSIGRAGRIAGMLDIFNLTNSGAVTNARVRSGSRYREVISLLDPRIVRVGFRYEF